MNEILKDKDVLDFICDLITDKCDYKSRIEKAVEYLKKHSSNGEYFMEWYECSDLLDILNGRSDE